MRVYASISISISLSQSIYLSISLSISLSIFSICASTDIRAFDNTPRTKPRTKSTALHCIAQASVLARARLNSALCILRYVRVLLYIKIHSAPTPAYAPPPRGVRARARARSRGTRPPPSPLKKNLVVHQALRATSKKFSPFYAIYFIYIYVRDNALPSEKYR